MGEYESSECVVGTQVTFRIILSGKNQRPAAGVTRNSAPAHTLPHQMPPQPAIAPLFGDAGMTLRGSVELQQGMVIKRPAPRMNGARGTFYFTICSFFGFSR